MDNPYRSPNEPAGTVRPPERRRPRRRWRLWRIAILYGMAFGGAIVGAVLAQSATTVTGEPSAIVAGGLMGLLVASMILLWADTKEP
jgi:hypothetical protein